jgi:hypothetical protein
MSHHDEHDDTCEHGAQADGGPDTRFLDFELHKVMYDEAESIVREAYRELLKDAIKQRLQARWGARITALGQLAADEAMADADANFESRRGSRPAIPHARASRIASKPSFATTARPSRLPTSDPRE